MPVFIPLIDQRLASSTASYSGFLQAASSRPIAATGLLSDSLGRPLRDLRISVTDRCNFRCSYCMPKEVFDKDYQYLPHNSLLSFEEIARAASIFVAHGTQKIRLTGGEPLLRKNLEVLVGMLAKIKTVEGEPLDITLTTNGSLLRRKAQALKNAGLQRVTISLDGLDDATFRAMNDVDFPVADVLDGIQAAQEAGLKNIKVNMVVKRGTNEQEILPMARHFQGTGVTLRFIEYMDVGATNGWRMNEVMASSEVVQHIHARMPLVQLNPSAPGETAERWGYVGANGQHDPQLGRSRRHQQRYPGFLRRLQPCPLVHRRQAVPVPICQPRLRHQKPAAGTRRQAGCKRCRISQRHRPHLARPHRPVQRVTQLDGG